MLYGRNKKERIYYSSTDVATKLGIPSYQVARLEARFSIAHRKNRAGSRFFLEKELNQFKRIVGLLSRGKSTDEIKAILKNEEDIRSSLDQINNKDFSAEIPKPKTSIPASTPIATPIAAPIQSAKGLKKADHKRLISELESILKILKSS